MKDSHVIIMFTLMFLGIIVMIFTFPGDLNLLDFCKVSLNTTDYISYSTLGIENNYVECCYDVLVEHNYEPKCEIIKYKVKE